MPEQIATVFVDLFYAYLVFGFLFAVLFVFRGVQTVDTGAAGTSRAFRLLLLPGTLAFWPLLLLRWIHASGQPPTERNPHR